MIYCMCPKFLFFSTAVLLQYFYIGKTFKYSLHWSSVITHNMHILFAQIFTFAQIVLSPMHYHVNSQQTTLIKALWLLKHIKMATGRYSIAVSEACECVSVCVNSPACVDTIHRRHKEPPAKQHTLSLRGRPGTHWGTLSLHAQTHTYRKAEKWVMHT